MAQLLETERLVLRPWQADDAAAALGAYGDAAVARWLTPAMDRVSDQEAMRLVLQRWVSEDARMLAPAGRWAVELRRSGRVGPRLRHRGRAGAGAVGIRAGHRTGHRDRAPGQHPRRGDATPDRHGVGRRDREVPQPAAAGIPPSSRGPHRAGPAPGPVRDSSIPAGAVASGPAPRRRR